MGLGAGGLALVSRGGEGDAVGALSAAQEFVEQAESYRAEVRQTSHVSFGDPDGAGSDTTTRTVTHLVVGASDRWQLTQDLGDQFGFGEGGEFSTVRIAGSLYVQDGFADLTGSQVGPTWIELP